MKLSPWLLALTSLALNAILIAALAMRQPAPRDDPFPSATVLTSNAAGSAVKPAAANAKPAPSDAVAEPSTSSLWSQLSSRDPAVFENNLRASGFSLGARRGAVYALLRDLQTAERTKAVESLPLEPFWQSRSPVASSPEYEREISRLWLERDRIMRRIFPEEQQAFLYRQQARYGPLPLEKLEKLARLDHDYAEMRSQLSRVLPMPGLRMPWHTEQMEYLYEEQRKDATALLTPEEKAEYDLRASPLSRTLRPELAHFDPTEREFRDIFRVRSAIEEKFGAGNWRALRALETSAEARHELPDQLKQMLGPGRYADYERSTDRGMVASTAIAQRLNLPANTGLTVYALQQDVRAREAAIQADPAKTPAQRDAELTALANEAKQKLSTLLTPSGLDQYRLETGGRGLPILERPTFPRR